MTNIPNTKRQLLRLCALGALATLAGAAMAQATFPSKPVTIVTAYPPGGGADLTARIVAQELSEYWKQPVIVDSRPGAGTTISAAYVARAPADGYTLLMSTVALTTASTLYKNLPYNYLTSFAPISLVARSPFFLTVRPGLKVESVADLVALARSKPDALNYASAGSGSIPHLAGAWLGTLTGTRATHVPFQGTAPAVTALLGDQVDFLFADVSTVSTIKAGKLRALGVTAERRMEALPQVPLMSETIPGFELHVWAALEAPAGTPKEVIEKIHTAIQAATRSPALIKRFGDLAQEARSSTPQELAALKASQTAHYEKLLNTAGVKLD